ncbi:P-loop containing nucleoside triphosphate hydrolase protein [Jimgerdemannia flammicorona]|uniref:P-loop containing nucleoside triphosphate hydrolase protein n=1 Tax=Jimgerdemannia flammicorona TaxID=994334 RepID=A0A433D3M3_9FUNG|nr:P-loop containing nucleoside triphosphate hydrolase protein [Jimgerdemannia flammicorona]
MLVAKTIRTVPLRHAPVASSVIRELYTKADSPAVVSPDPEAGGNESTSISPPFVPNPHFTHARSINWFPGHMARGLRLISSALNSVDLVVEVRDARIPLSSVNPKFEYLVGCKDRLIIYNKADLAHPTTQSIITSAFKTHSPSTPVIFTNALADHNVRLIISHAARRAVGNTTVMIVGMPNVGKSSLVNSLRRVGVGKGKAAATGSQPGVTRTVAGTIKVLEDPVVYLIDTPGVMVPHIPDPITSLKVALTGGVRDHLADEQVMADYLLYRLNLFGAFGYAEYFRLPDAVPTNEVHVLLPYIAQRVGAVVKGGELDLNAAARFFIKHYRDGKLGRFTLDDMREEMLKEFFVKGSMGAEAGEGLSRRQEKKKQKMEDRRRARERDAAKPMVIKG